MRTLEVVLVQQASGLEPAANRDALLAVGATLASGRPADLVVLPEAIARDFGPPGSDVSPYAEPLDGPFVAACTALAATSGATVVAGMFEVGPDPRRPFNTVVVADAGGLRASYRKIHLYDSFGYRESDRLTAGGLEPLVVEVAGTHLGVMTCYDLRFPELARLLTRDGAEVLVVPSAWVAGPGKVEHWRTLSLARAIENTVYVAAVGQPGPRYTGHSLVVAPDGGVVAEVGDGPHLLRATLDGERLEAARSANPSLANRRL